MTEEEARHALATGCGASREQLERLAAFVAFLSCQARQQNLIARSTHDQIWTRHILDSAQLVPLAARAPPGTWLDMGSGAGFPGLIAAMFNGRRTLLVESRRLRCAFLSAAADVLHVKHNVDIIHRRAEALDTAPAAIISARAFAPIGRLLSIGARFSSRQTLWLLPMGKTGNIAVERARASWHGAFHVKQSVTDPASAIIVASEICKK